MSPELLFSSPPFRLLLFTRLPSFSVFECEQPPPKIPVKHWLRFCSLRTFSMVNFIACRFGKPLGPLRARKSLDWILCPRGAPSWDRSTTKWTWSFLVKKETSQQCKFHFQINVCKIPRVVFTVQMFGFENTTEENQKETGDANSKVHFCRNFFSVASVGEKIVVRQGVALIMGFLAQPQKHL